MLSLRQTYLHRKIQRDIILSRHPITAEKFIVDCEFENNINNEVKCFILSVRKTIGILANIPCVLIRPDDILERDIYISHWLWGIDYSRFMKILEAETHFNFEAKLLEKVQDPEIAPEITVKCMINEFLSIYKLQVKGERKLDTFVQAKSDL
jgi:hypothetical protein